MIIKKLNEVYILNTNENIFKKIGIKSKKIKINKNLVGKIYSWFNRNLKNLEESLAYKNSFWKRNVIFLKVGDKISPSFIIEKLEKFGYKRTYNVSMPLEYSLKGSIIEVFPLNYKGPLKIDFIGDIIEKIVLIEDFFKDYFYFLEKEIKFDKNLKDLIEPGDYLVHINHGIGIYRGIKIINNKEYILIEYAKKDKLFVPSEQTEKITPYIGFRKPKIHRLSTNLWHNTKKRATENIIKFAKELLEIYAKREVAKRKCLSSSFILAKEFLLSLEYELTEDQKKAIEDIEKDITLSEKPMERLICGDVGFGKTDIAIYSALRFIEEGRQVALISPTLILAYQHYKYIKKRIKNFKVNICFFSRISKKNKEKEIIEQLSTGKIDFIIGTHRLLSKDVKFKNLGLLIIDEEQKFGVRQKEHLKKIKRDLDVLLITATPIPRTLYLALSKIKSMSLILTPPKDKKSPKTFVKEFSWKEVEKAIEREVKRKGQVFYLHNRIGTILKPYNKIKKMFRNLKVSILHARLPAQEILRIFDEFKNKKIDVLITTTIIQNGLDIKNVNTLIVEEASMFGLSDLHQLRGRIGRGKKTAFCYFFYSKTKYKKGKAKLRLKYIKKYSKLGEGYYLALKDLELRGAGNILGKEQSGVINKIGFNLYYELLSKILEKLKLS